MMQYEQIAESCLRFYRIRNDYIRSPYVFNGRNRLSDYPVGPRIRSYDFRTSAADILFHHGQIHGRRKDPALHRHLSSGRRELFYDRPRRIQIHRPPLPHRMARLYSPCQSIAGYRGQAQQGLFLAHERAERSAQPADRAFFARLHPQSDHAVLFVQLRTDLLGGYANCVFFQEDVDIHVLCINTGNGDVKTTIDKTDASFVNKNTYTTNKDARCVGVFILPELG